MFITYICYLKNYFQNKFKDIIGRCGWLLKEFHTFFDYWQSTGKSMTKSGRVMNGWPVNDGGVPPTFNHVKTNRHKIVTFVNSLLGHTKLPSEITSILVANGLRFYSNFCEILRHEPTGKYNTEESMISKHKFIWNVSL